MKSESWEEIESPALHDHVNWAGISWHLRVLRMKAGLFGCGREAAEYQKSICRAAMVGVDVIHSCRGRLERAERHRQLAKLWVLHWEEDLKKPASHNDSQYFLDNKCCAERMFSMCDLYLEYISIRNETIKSLTENPQNLWNIVLKNFFFPKKIHELLF